MAAYVVLHAFSDDDVISSTTCLVGACCSDDDSGSDDDDDDERKPAPTPAGAETLVSLSKKYMLSPHMYLRQRRRKRGGDGGR